MQTVRKAAVVAANKEVIVYFKWINSSAIPYSKHGIHGIPWYTIVYHGTPVWYTMVYHENHGIPWYDIRVWLFTAPDCTGQHRAGNDWLFHFDDCYE